MSQEVVEPYADVPFAEIPTWDEFAVQEATNEPLNHRMSRRDFLLSLGSGGLILTAGALIGRHEWDIHHPVKDVVQDASDKAVNILTPPTSTPTPTESPQQSPEQSDRLPRSHEVPLGLETRPPKLLTIPKLGMYEAPIVPVPIGKPTGKKNDWGGPIYEEIHFSTKDKAARYWMGLGLPNTVVDASVNVNPQEVLRTVVLGHASDLGHNLVFQRLSSMKPGDEFMTTSEYPDGEYVFTWQIYKTGRPSKGSGLANDKDIFLPPENGRKEIVLIACLPNTDSHQVCIGFLAGVKKVGEKPL